MTLPRSAADVLADHVVWELECIDRMYLNLYVPKLMFANGIAQFFRDHRGQPFVSSALMNPMTKDFVRSIHRFVDDHGVDLVHFRKGQRKDDIAHSYLARHDGSEGVLFVGRAQEKTNIFRTQKRRNPVTGKTYPWLVADTAMVNHFYFYGFDDDFGPFFIKFATYFPYTAKVWLLRGFRHKSHYAPVPIMAVRRGHVVASSVSFAASRRDNQRPSRNARSESLGR